MPGHETFIAATRRLREPVRSLFPARRRRTRSVKPARNVRPSGQGPRDSNTADPRLKALIALLVTLTLIAAGDFLTHELRSASRLQDCVMSGRTNCAPIDPHAP